MADVTGGLGGDETPRETTIGTNGANATGETEEQGSIGRNEAFEQFKTSEGR